MPPAVYRLRASWLALLLLLATTGPLAAQPAAEVEIAPPALEAIRTDDLRADLTRFASDAFRGRAAGTLDELRSGAWLAEQARAAGLEPAGDDGTFFQFFHVRRTDLTPNSRIAFGPAGTREALAIGREAFTPLPSEAHVEGAVVRYAPGVDLRGHLVVIETEPPAELSGIREDVAAFQHFIASVMGLLPTVIGGGAAAIVAVPDAVTGQWFDELAHMMGRGLFQLEGTPEAAQQLPAPIVIVRPGVFPEDVSGFTGEIRLQVASHLYPSVNVVARAPGADEALAHEHVLFSAHHDHDGVGEIDGEETIWNGADDNGSGSVALLAIGRAFVEAPARRSALFVWHGAEERGLLGSRLFADRPTLPREDLVAVLNADMIGRNHPDTSAVLGIRTGHRNSPELAEAALRANDAVAQFVIDDSWDDPDHPEQFFMRSDHFPYVQQGIPALFFTTALHPEYHTPQDTVDLIDFDKLTQMARWIYTTGWLVAEADERPSHVPTR